VIFYTVMGGGLTRSTPSRSPERGDRVLKDMEIESSLAVFRFARGGQNETEA
jgi:hypothetical protein